MRHLRHCLVLLVVFHTISVAQPSLYRIVDFGAVGDGKTLNTVAIQTAIDTCFRAGGGTVSVPPGVFVTGTLQLRSNINLCLESGAVLRGSERLEDYLLDGKRVGLIFTRDAMNVSITGTGTIDGNGDSFMVLDRAKRIEHGGTTWTRQKNRFREVHDGLGDGPLEPKERPFQMIIFSDCRNVLVRDVLITNSPFWTLHCADCDGVLIAGVKIWCNLLVPNNDGLDFTSCSNVLVSDCDIRTGDDCIAITGYSHHFDLPGFKDLRRSCENITVQNCLMTSRSAAIRIGGFDQNPMRNFTFNNIIITQSNRGIGIFARDEGSIENITFSNMVIETRLFRGDWWGNGEPIHISAARLTKDVPLGRIKNIRFQNLVCKGEAGMLVYGTPESPVENVSFSGVSFQITQGPLNDLTGGNFDLRPVLDEKLQLFSHDIPGIYAQYVNNLRIQDFDLAWGPVTAPFFTHGIEVNNFDGLTIDRFKGSGAPGSLTSRPIVIRNGRGADIRAGNVLKEGVRP